MPAVESIQSPAKRTRFPETFRSGHDNTGAGGLAYFAMVPVLTLAVFGFVGAVLQAGLTAAGMDEEFSGKLLAVTLLPLIIVLLSWFAIRDFRRRAGAEITVTEDSIVVSSEFYQTRYGYDEITNLRIVPEGSRDACRLELADGRGVHLLSEVATWQQLQPYMEAGLLGGFVGRLKSELKNGGTIWVNESRIRAFLRVLWGVGGMGIALFFFYLVPFLPWMPGFKPSARRIRRGWRGMTGGFSITGSTVNAVGIVGSDLFTLTNLINVMTDEIGVTLYFQGGSKITASPFARNYSVTTYFLSHLLDSLPNAAHRA